MGHSLNKPVYEGYGKNKSEAAISLGYLLRYHHSNVTVHSEKRRFKNDILTDYYVFDGVNRHYIYFTHSNEIIKAKLN
jgi:hypothetical protein